MSTLSGALPTYIGRCKCPRDWELMIGGRGRCGACGEVPTYARDVPEDEWPVARVGGTIWRTITPVGD